jgi:beta-aspartyl-peptidase (threonine type)
MNNQKIAIVVHGGAGPDSSFIKENIPDYEAGLSEAAEAGRAVLMKGGTATDAVCAAVASMEDNFLFNAGKGAALNHEGSVEMDAAIMNGHDLKAGAVAMVKKVRNPILLAYEVLKKTNHILLAGEGALEFAKDVHAELMIEEYFVTEHQLEELAEARHESKEELLRKRIRGTIGAVALDQDGNIAAATSTGGTTNSLPGRVGDSCLIGAGCYANNETCAVSGTGDGEILIQNVAAHSVAMLIELGKHPLQEACDLVINDRNRLTGDIGLIAVNQQGQIGIAFNSERMHRAWALGSDPVSVKIY